MGIRLKNWSIFRNGGDFLAPELCSYHLQWFAFGHSKFADGSPISTSRIVKIEDLGDHKEATTRSGSVYHLYESDVDPECEKIYPNYYKRLKLEVK